MNMSPDPNILDIVKLVLQFAVLPLAGFMWAHYRMTQTHETALAVMRSEHALVKESHDREFKEVKEAFKSVMSKLDEIQKALPR
jgi:hypothetical protein